MSAIDLGEKLPTAAAIVHAITTGDAGDEYAILCGAPFPPVPGLRWQSRNERRNPRRRLRPSAKAPVRSITVAPARCAACQFPSVSALFPAKNAN